MTKPRLSGYCDISGNCVGHHDRGILARMVGRAIGAVPDLAYVSFAGLRVFIRSATERFSDRAGHIAFVPGGQARRLRSRCGQLCSPVPAARCCCVRVAAVAEPAGRAPPSHTGLTSLDRRVPRLPVRLASSKHFLPAFLPSSASSSVSCPRSIFGSAGSRRRALEFHVSDLASCATGE